MTLLKKLAFTLKSQCTSFFQEEGGDWVNSFGKLIQYINNASTYKKHIMKLFFCFTVFWFVKNTFFTVELKICPVFNYRKNVVTIITYGWPLDNLDFLSYHISKRFIKHFKKLKHRFEYFNFDFVDILL